MAFDANINLTVTSTQAERAVNKLEQKFNKLEDAARDILSIDRQIINERRKLLNLSGTAARNQQKRIADLRLQRSELVLQKRELKQIETLERRRAQSLGVAAPGTPRERSGGGGTAFAVALPAPGQSVAQANKIADAYQKVNNLQEGSYRRAGDVNRLLGIREGILNGLNRQRAIQLSRVEELRDLERRLNTISGSKNPELTQRLQLPDEFKLSKRGDAELAKLNARIKEQNIGLEEAKRLRDLVYKRFTLNAAGQIKKAENAQAALNNAINTGTNNLKAQERAYESINTQVRQIDATERRRALNAQASLDAIDKRNRAQAASKRRFKGISTGVGAGLATANLPGQNIFQAGLAGSALGGKAGFIAGATTGGVIALSAAFLKFANGAARAEAELQKLEIALGAVAGSETQAALKGIERAVDDFNIPIQDATRNFTQLTAAGAANGNSVDELETLYRGLAAATKATGGDAEDLNGVLRAATQVLSKGKVQAEELRGQIGDRLPGAFQLFAEATGRSTAELDKALEKGEVSAKEFVDKFGQFILEKYEPAAKKIGDSPAEAGARLKRALDDLNRAAGPALAELGSKFQNFSTNVIRALEPVAEYLAGLFNLGQEGNLKAYEQSLAKLAKLDGVITSVEQQLSTADGSAVRQIQANLDDLNKQRQKLLKQIALQNSSLPRNENKPTGNTRPIAVEPFTTSSGSTGAGSTIDGDAAGRALGQDLAARLEKIRLQDQLLDRLNAQLALEKETDAMRKIELRSQLELLQVEQDINNRKINAGETLQQQLEQERKIRVDLLSLQTDQARQAEKLSQVQKGIQAGIEADGQIAEFSKLEETLNSIGSTITDGLVRGLSLAVTETERLGEAFRDLAADILEAIGKQLILNAITTGINALAGNDGVGLFSILNGSFGGNREFGGPVRPNEAYLTGEAGPELFVPNSGGTVVPNSALKALARYSPANGADNGAMGGGDSVGAAGGGAAGGGDTNVSMNYSGPTMVFDDTRYVPVTAVPSIVKEASEIGEARALRRLRMSPSARRKLGL